MLLIPLHKQHRGDGEWGMWSDCNTSLLLLSPHAFSCSTSMSLTQDAILQELLQRGSFPQTAVQEHLLWCGVFHGLQHEYLLQHSPQRVAEGQSVSSLCSPWAAGESLHQHPSFFTDFGPCRIVSHFFSSLLFITAATQPLLPFLIYVFTEVPSASLISSALASCESVLGVCLIQGNLWHLLTEATFAVPLLPKLGRISLIYRGSSCDHPSGVWTINLSPSRSSHYHQFVCEVKS